MRNRLVVAILLGCAAALLTWAVVRQRELERGAEAFHQYGCAHCHGSSGAPNLTNVTQKYDEKTLREFIQNPESVYKVRGRRPLNDGYVSMPRLGVTATDAKAIVTYLKQQAD